MQYIACFTGFYLGVKVVDFAVYDENKCMVQREKLEDEFWAANGEPKEI